MEYFDNIRFHVCRSRFLPKQDRVFTPDTHSVEFIRNGQFLLRHNENVYTLNGPAVFWMKRSERYQLIQSGPGKRVEHFYCDCYGKKIEKLIRCLDQLFPNGYFTPADPGKTEEIFQKQISLFQQDMVHYHGELAITLDQLMIMAQRSSSSAQTVTTEDPYSIHLLAQEIRNHPFSDFDFSAFAARKGITYYHFRRLFKASYKIPPTEYVRNQKMIRACELLSMTDLQIKQIAHHCNYDSLMDFSRTFKKYTGISPTAYRAQKRS